MKPPGGTRFADLRIGDERFVVISVPIDAMPLADRLTAAERTVAKLAMHGLSNQEIAERRGTSVRTVANQIATILRKLGLSSRRELAARAVG